MLAETYPDAHCELDFADPLQLLVATVLTLIFLPTLYVTWFGWQERREAAKPKVFAETSAPQA